MHRRSHEGQTRPPAYDEMRDSAGGIRSHYEAFERWHGEQSAESMAVRRLEADLSFRRVGITRWPATPPAQND